MYARTRRIFDFDVVTDFVHHFYTPVEHLFRMTGRHAEPDSAGGQRSGREAGTDEAQTLLVGLTYDTPLREGEKRQHVFIINF